MSTLPRKTNFPMSSQVVSYNISTCIQAGRLTATAKVIIKNITNKDAHRSLRSLINNRYSCAVTILVNGHNLLLKHIADLLA